MYGLSFLLESPPADPSPLGDYLPALMATRAVFREAAHQTLPGSESSHLTPEARIAYGEKGTHKFTHAKEQPEISTKRA